VLEWKSLLISWDCARGGLCALENVLRGWSIGDVPVAYGRCIILRWELRVGRVRKIVSRCQA